MSTSEAFAPLAAHREAGLLGQLNTKPFEALVFPVSELVSKLVRSLV